MEEPELDWLLRKLDNCSLEIPEDLALCKESLKKSSKVSGKIFKAINTRCRIHNTRSSLKKLFSITETVLVESLIVLYKQIFFYIEILNQS